MLFFLAQVLQRWCKVIVFFFKKKLRCNTLWMIVFNWTCCLTTTWIFCHRCSAYRAEYRSTWLYVLSQVLFGMDLRAAACGTSWQRDFCWKCMWNQIPAWCQPLCLRALRHSLRLSSRGYETVCYDHNAADIVKGVNVEIFHCAPVCCFLNSD